MTKTPEDKALADAGLPALSESEKKSAQREGVKEAAKEAAKDNAEFIADTAGLTNAVADKWLGKDEIMQHAHLVDLGLDEFKKVIADGSGLAENKVAGLLELERSGKNRTDYVRALCTRLGVKSPYEVTSAGPAFTNDMTAITEL